MSALPDTKGRCYFCTKDVGRANLKACSQCRLVKYCSKECQRAAWPAHKTRCILGSAVTRDMGAADEEFSTAMSKWMNCWRGTLALFCVPAMDLPNHPPNRLSTHCVAIELKRNSNAPTRAQAFSMVQGAIMSRQDFTRLILADIYSEEAIEAWEKDNRGDHSLQVCIGCENHMRFVWLQMSEENIQYFRSMNPAETAYLAAVWEKELIEKIASGEPA
ncbi:hypothetical protein EIP86_005020 [Pleurotus ostreatoroseus]|nr:hypothetical protein EIP86_005020 [Pleurotus ostreatoroseus]